MFLVPYTKRNGLILPKILGCKLDPVCMVIYCTIAHVGNLCGPQEMWNSHIKDMIQKTAVTKVIIYVSLRQNWLGLCSTSQHA